MVLNFVDRYILQLALIKKKIKVKELENLVKSNRARELEKYFFFVEYRKMSDV